MMENKLSNQQLLGIELNKSTANIFKHQLLFTTQTLVSEQLSTLEGLLSALACLSSGVQISRSIHSE